MCPPALRQIAELDVCFDDGRTLHAYDTGLGRAAAAGEASASPVSVFWLHGSPNLGRPPEPLFAAAEANGLRWISYDRPGYGGSSPHDGRTVASAAFDVAAIADALGIEHFAVFGHSGGGPHALSCAALLPKRVIAAVSVSAPAPLTADGLDWFADWSPGLAAENRAATAGRAALQTHWANAAPEEMSAFFTERDIAALDGDWSWLGDVTGQAIEQGDEGLVEDTLAAVQPWGFRPEDIGVPVLIMHGESDKMVPVAHGRWLAAHCPTATLRTIPDAGHITVLDSAPDALTWIGTRSRDKL